MDSKIKSGAAAAQKSGVHRRKKSSKQKSNKQSRRNHRQSMMQQDMNKATNQNMSQSEKQSRNSAPVQTGGAYEIEIDGLSHDGQGVGRIDGFTVFVADALPGERAKIQMVDVKKNYGVAVLDQLLERSEDRVMPPCPVYDRCGGCQLQHLNYEAQLRWKRQMVIDNLKRIGKLDIVEADLDETGMDRAGVIVHPTIGMEDPWRYRNKAVVPFGEEGGRLIGGFFEQGSHRIVDMDSCIIQDEQNDTLIRHIKRIAEELGIPAYDRVRHHGVLRHVVVRVGMRTRELMLVLVTNGRQLPKVEEFVERIREAVRESQPDYTLKSICQNVNTKRTSLIFGDETHVLWGSETIEDRIGDVRFAISARSFYQVNSVQTEVLYGKALEYARLTGDETVIDAYCGIGTISLFLAQQARKVYGVEIVPEAIEDARLNAELNGITNAEFVVGRAEDVFPRWYEEGVTADVVVVDPPRKGCERSLLDTIIEMKPKRVVYVSCNPSTLARDLRVLEDGGYRTVEVQPVDMFPHSGHVECVVLMSRVEVYY